MTSQTEDNNLEMCRRNLAAVRSSIEYQKRIVLRVCERQVELTWEIATLKEKIQDAMEHLKT